MDTLQIDIVSDIACPWCAIGYARLKQAMEQLGPDYRFNVEWRAFELNPYHSGKGQPIVPALAKKYGRSEHEMRAAQSNMMAIAKDLGVNFDKLQERLTANTFDGHRLVKWAAEQGQQTAMKLALFEAYFGKALDIADSQVLLDCVGALGLDQAAAKKVLESDQYEAAVRQDEETYQNAGVSSVPAFIINRKYLISGAQDSNVLVKALRDISEEAAESV
jgi:predicted DsbA family dithiol-disulfide isomerase